jgi:iron complex outermembrane receptor protein
MSRVISGRNILAATIATLCAHTSVAEPVDEVIVTATRQAQELRDYAGSVSVVSGDDVSLVGSTHHSEIINRAPGAMIQRNSGQESLTAIRSPVLSGPGSCGVFLFLENSIPIRPVGFCNVNELFEIDSEQARSIEVLRGPTGVVYGSGAMHGAVNVIQPRPDQIRQQLSLEAGADEFYRGKLAMGHTWGSTSFGGQILGSHDGGWRDASGLEEQKLDLGLTHRLQSGSELALNLSATNLNQETAGFIQGFDAYKNETIAKSNANPEAFRDANAARLTGEYSTQLNEGAKLSIRPYYRHSRMNFLQHFLVGKPLEENGQDSLGVLSAVDFNVLGGSSLLVGLDLEMADGFLKETQRSAATDGTPAQNVVRPAGKHYDYEVESEVAALYAQFEHPFADRWHFTIGARGEYVNYDYDNKMINGNTRDNGVQCAAATGCLYSRPADREDDFSNVTSKVGLSVDLTDAHAVYVTAARAYRAPDTSELYRLQRQQSIADLDPEKLDSIEVGGRGDVGTLRYSLAVFAMKKDNVIFRDSNLLNVSDGKTKHRGVEYELSWSPFETVTLAGGGTYAEHTYDFSRTVEQGETITKGKDVDTAPRHVNTARVSWQFLPVANTELEWVSVGRYWADAANAHEYPGHDLLNLRVGWNIGETWRTTLRLNNVTDKAYADRADFAFGNYRYFPGRGRTLFVEVAYRPEAR